MGRVFKRLKVAQKEVLIGLSLVSRLVTSRTLKDVTPETESDQKKLAAIVTQLLEQEEYKDYQTFAVNQFVVYPLISRKSLKNANRVWM